MNAYEKLKSSRMDFKKMAEDKCPKQYEYTKHPQNGMPFIARVDVFEAAIVFKKFKDTSYSVAHILDEKILPYLNVKDFCLCSISVIKTEEEKLHVAITKIDSKSPWTISRKESLFQAEEGTVVSNRDTVIPKTSYMKLILRMM
ncbi:hypothetical protein [Psychromonas ossibalaenae]|uniref:hypothetical protein n=1 Tax=Psychromonas ossibalaenae TaxID=444922 RepID=UPI0003809D2D|nr:hypothetical protein [Psychromonas ossibalaenae]